LKSLPKDSFRFVQGDICDVDLVNKVVPGHQAILNFAAESHVDRSIQSSRNFITTNVVGVGTLLEATRKHSIEKFVQISTDEVYGSIREGSWKEDFPLQPNSPYSASKAAADLIAQSFCRTHSVDIRITRCSNNYGPNQFPEKIIPLFITNLIDNLKLPLYGDGLNVRDWLHVDDHCRGIHLVLTKGKAGEIYNIGGGKEFSNKELAHAIIKEMGKNEDEIQFVEDRKGHDFRYSVDITKISEELQYSPKIPFGVGLKSTIEWYKSNEAWWRPLRK
jgi:dTDP-glucose 4,6-dehydratase